MKIIKDQISKHELSSIAEAVGSDLIKAVVDIKRQVMAIGGELHADEEVLLLEDGSQQLDLWGINIYPDKDKDDRIEFDSLINIRPYLGNRTRGVDDPKVRERIIEIVNKLITKF
ncbi:MAG: DUF5674 family protein [Bacteroidota bacterium]